MKSKTNNNSHDKCFYQSETRRHVKGLCGSDDKGKSGFSIGCNKYAWEIQFSEQVVRFVNGNYLPSWQCQRTTFKNVPSIYTL